MGYTTTFDGGFTFNKPITLDMYNTINNFAAERHEPRLGGCPGCWCQWIIVTDYNGNEALIWDQNEKFYEYVPWLNYLITNFFEPAGYVLNGTVDYQGEELDDFGTIEVKDNEIIMHYGIHATDLSSIDINDLVYEMERRGYTCTYNC